jgi:hypothetical protein
MSEQPISALVPPAAARGHASAPQSQVATLQEQLQQARVFAFCRGDAMNMRIEAAVKSNATDVERLLELANLPTEGARECIDSTIVAWANGLKGAQIRISVGSQYESDRACA